MVSKLMFDISLVILHALDNSKVILLNEGTPSWVAVDLLLYCSITCVTSAEFLYLWNAFEGVSGNGLGWFWRRVGPVATSTLALLKFLPLVDLHNGALHLYLLFGASFLDFSLFSLMYWRILIGLHNDRKWRSRLAVCLLYCPAVALSALISLVEGWKVSWIRSILSKIFLLLVTTQFSVRSIYVETAFAVQASDESVGILNHDTGSRCRRPSATSTARKQLIIDTTNAAELYAWSQMTKEEVLGEGKMIRTDSKVENGCMEGNVNSHSAHITSKEPSPLSNPQRFSFSFHASPPLGWLPSMTGLTLSEFSKGEDFETIIILLETEWSDIIERVSVSWLKHVIKEITDFAKDLFSQGKDLDSTRISLEDRWPHLSGRFEFGWLQRVAEVAAEDFAKRHFAQGKNLEEIRMSLQKQWPHLSGRFDFSCLEHLTEEVVVVDSDTVSINLDLNIHQFQVKLKLERQLSQVVKFVKHHFSKGKDLKEIRILLQKEWPHLTDRFEFSWLEHLTEGVVVVNSDTVLDRCWRCELEMEVSGITKCCEHFNQGSGR